MLPPSVGRYVLRLHSIKSSPKLAQCLEMSKF
jgi:hypothetical protein